MFETLLCVLSATSSQSIYWVVCILKHVAWIQVEKGLVEDYMFIVSSVAFSCCNLKSSVLMMSYICVLPLSSKKVGIDSLASNSE